MLRLCLPGPLVVTPNGNSASDYAGQGMFLEHDLRMVVGQQRQSYSSFRDARGSAILVFRHVTQ
jgi:hypothetical protein